jgi:tetratricopeptide (TPR) repeat protein
MKAPLITLIFLLTVTSSVLAQKKQDPYVAIADKSFNGQDFYAAAQQYAHALEKDSNSYVLYQLGECYRLYFDFHKAEFFYQRVLARNPKQNLLTLFWYATCLKENDKLSLSIENYKKFRELDTQGDFEMEIYKEKALQEMQNCEKSLSESKSPLAHKNNFQVLPKPVNSSEGEYSPFVFENDSFLLITTARKGSIGGAKDNSFGGNRTDIFRFKKTHDSTWTVVHHNHHDEFNKLNTVFNESGGSMTLDKKKLYFTRCDDFINNEYNCAIYVSYNVHGRWEKAIRLNDYINMPGQFNSQPSISSDGNLLFFVSKRPGGLGMTDIWFSTSNGDDNWSMPYNLGPKINSPLSDMSPFYDSENRVLFYSSNGKGGLGGLDVFGVNDINGEQQVQNLGIPFNSNRDDFYFTLGNKKGYMSSNRNGGVGFDDIYSFEFANKKQFIIEFFQTQKLESDIK